MKRISLFLLLLMVLAASCSQEPVVWDQPVMESGIYGDGYNHVAVEVIRVEQYKDETILHLRILLRSNYPDEFGFGIRSSSCLVADGKTCRALSVDGIQFDEWTNTDPDGKKDIAIHFEPLPEGTLSFDFTEGGDEDGWNITGIKPVESCCGQLIPSYWANVRTGNWDLAFLDDGYAVYDCKVWEIESVEYCESGAAEMVLTRGGEKLSVGIGKDRKGRRTISIDGRKARYSMITGRFLPEGPVKDKRTGFVDLGSEVDTVTVSGWLRNMPEQYCNDRIFELDLHDIMTGGQEEYSAFMDSLGCFSVKIPLKSSTEFFCDWSRCMLRTLLEPGKTYFLIYDFKDGRRMFMGDDCRLQNELLRYPLDWNKVEMEQGADYDGYIADVDSFLQAQNAGIDEFCREHPKISSRYRIYRKEHTLWEQAFAFGQSHFRAKNRQMTENAISYALETFWSKMGRPYTQHREMSMFWNDFIIGLTGQSGSYKPLDISGHIGEMTSDPEEQELLRTWFAWSKEAAEELNPIEDPEEYRRRGEELREQNAGMLTKVNVILHRLQVERIIRQLMLTERIQRQKHIIDSVGTDSSIRDYIIAETVFDIFKLDHSPLSAAVMDSIRVWIDDPEIFGAIERKNEDYIAISNRDFDRLVLKSNDNVAGMTEGEQILRKILAPYKGKIVLIDIWGTWCGPCKEALSHSTEEYERMSKYDMEFVYLADKSPEDAWKNIIREYNVSGPNVAHFNLPKEQQEAVEEYLDIRYFPSYILVDRSGNILNFNVNARNLDVLEDLVKKL